MSTDLAAPLPAPLKNRRGWLIAFGIFQILIGCFCLLMLAFLLISLPTISHASRTPGAPELPTIAVVMAFLVYGGLGAVFLALGVGSIMCKNWARIGTQIVSGFWLVTGLLSGLALVFVLPGVVAQQGKVPPEQQHLMYVVMGVFMALFMVLLPATLLGFYSLRSVRATCLAGGLGPASTAVITQRAASQTPISIILLALWECLGVLALLSLLVVRGNVVFGIVVVGPAIMLLMVPHAILCGIAAWLIFRRDYLGWKISFFKLLFWSASWAVTLWRRDLLEVYQQMGFSGEQLQLMQQLPHLQVITVVSSAAGFGLYLVLLLYTRKFFARAGNAN